MCILSSGAGQEEKMEIFRSQSTVFTDFDLFLINNFIRPPWLRRKLDLVAKTRRRPPMSGGCCLFAPWHSPESFASGL